MKRRGFVALVGGFFLLALRQAAHAICNPSLVRWFAHGPEFVQARGKRSPQLGSYFIQWFGHSSFLIQSGSQTMVVTDPNLNVTPGIQADAITVSNDHFTHNNVGAVSGSPLILRGITSRQTWNPIRTTVKDIIIVNIPSQRGPVYGLVANSIFIYEMGSLCLCHLGNMGHLFTPEQEKILQKVDVMMTPIDAMTNLGFDDLVKVIEQVRPPVVIPMHYDVPQQADLFATHIGDRYPIRRIRESRLVLNRAMLPKSTEIFILTHPRPLFSSE
ncbi:MAG: MBL fold metallo-hydrolase [Deltaproteobacteria bacterium]|nr:MBL fold metallo-hydrolase [Deltaproteobacteria bacterium]